MMRLSIVIGAIAIALFWATAAQASYTIGQTTGAADNCGSGQVLVQRSVNAAPSYTASSDGVVVSWSYLAHAGNSNITFKVYHSTAQVATWFVRSASAERNPGAGAGQIHPNQLNTFAESPGLPIQTGDVLGLTGRAGTGMACISTSSANDRIRVKNPPDPPPGADSPGFAGELPQLKLGVTAVVEPDADGDHFGDETQDGCPTDATVHVTACPIDVQVVKTASANPVVGADMTYTLAVKNNNATSAAGGVGVTDTLPAGVTFVSSSTSQGTCSGDATVACALGPLAAGASATVSIVVKPGAAGPLSNTANVSTTSPDTDSSNDSSTAQTTVVEPIVAPILGSLKVTPAAFRAKKGTTVSYTNSQDSTTTFTVAKRARGVKKGKRCVAPPKKKPKKKPVRCTRFLKRATFTRPDKAGPVSFHYNARVKGKLLKPGRYRLRAVARNSAGASLPLTASFRIKKP
jgi:uncharacterized repeat protein (TIGR01451 family)